VVIKGGTIYGGMAETPYTADIGVVDGIIKTIGDIEPTTGLAVDAKGLIVAPGFIDIHTHCEDGLQTEKGKNAKNYLMQGVTTVVTGNCGGGTHLVEEFFSKLKSQGVGLNVIHLVGHGMIRNSVMGQKDREPTVEEIERMKQFLARGMKEGAAGFSSGLFYAPGSFAKTDEIIELAKVAKKYDGFYATHIRDESNYSIGLNSLSDFYIVGGVSVSATVMLGGAVILMPAQIQKVAYPEEIRFDTIKGATVQAEKIAETASTFSDVLRLDVAGPIAEEMFTSVTEPRGSSPAGLI
jgi:N-acyl-D-aspartate/D-glutamate deacylase